MADSDLTAQGEDNSGLASQLSLFVDRDAVVE